MQKLEEDKGAIKLAKKGRKGKGKVRATFRLTIEMVIKST